jgi:hypothetical protein
MEKDHVPFKLQQLAALRKTPKPLFDLGAVVATPAVLVHLQRNGLPPVCLLSLHQHGEWGVVSAEDAKANVRAVADCSRILSVYLVGDEKVWVITEAESDDAKRQRASTCMLFPSEY